ncbi:MAG: hypothetical protein L0G99_11825 [Propionibacteriales bacterium]|nr:hypothetical protein [Propionibacteriales bacterium]
MNHSDTTAPPRRPTHRWLLGAAATLVVGLVVVLVVRPLVAPEAGRADLEREAGEVLAP